jgi:hypothetical protein
MAVRVRLKVLASGTRPQIVPLGLHGTKAVDIANDFERYGVHHELLLKTCNPPLKARSVI